MHVPRPRPPIWLRLLLAFGLIAAMLAFSFVSLMHRAPVERESYLGHDAANPWGPPK